MAIVTEIPWAPEFPPFEERLPGLHLTDILDRLEASVFGERKKLPYTAQERSHGADIEGQGYALPGFVWETALKHERHSNEMGVVHHPAGFEKDGILLSPDALLFPAAGLRIGESKFTWKKWDGNFYPDNPRWWRWFRQVMSYCHAAGTRFATFKVLFICGDYTGPRPFRPFSKWLDVEFTQGELERNWGMVLANKPKEEGEGK